MKFISGCKEIGYNSNTFKQHSVLDATLDQNTVQEVKLYPIFWEDFVFNSRLEWMDHPENAVKNFRETLTGR